MNWYLGFISLLFLGLVVSPATAFSFNNLEISINPDGNANISAGYSLSWIERFVVLMRIANPADILEQVLEQYYRNNVQVLSVSRTKTDLMVKDFATVTESETETTYTTPYLDFSGADQAIRGYWFSKFITVDASPQTAIVQFPDAYTETFSNSYTIPQITHKIPK